MTDLVNKLNKRFTQVSNRLTRSYEKTFGLPCDIYYPIHPTYKTTVKYRDMKIFGPHQQPEYNTKPDIKGTNFYIPHLIPKHVMNADSSEYDSYFPEDINERPFIETSKARELPLMTKVVVHQGFSVSRFFIDKKLVVSGADGYMLLRMYLSPLAKDTEEEKETVEDTSSSEAVETPVQEKEQEETVEAMTKEEEIYYERIEAEEGLEMNIPD